MNPNHRTKDYRLAQLREALSRIAVVDVNPLDHTDAIQVIEYVKAVARKALTDDDERTPMFP